MGKISTLCLSFLMAGLTMANAADKLSASKLLQHRKSAQIVSLQGANKRTSATMQLKALGQVAKAETVYSFADTVSSVKAPGFGWVTGPDGTQWYYTQTFELKGSSDAYSQSQVTVYDSSNKQVGQFTVDAPDSLEINMIDVYGDVTKKMFDRNDQTYEALVSLHYRGNASNNYVGGYITRAYSLDGTLAYECNGTGIFFDASKGWTSYQRLIVTNSALDADSNEVYKIDVMAPPSWNETAPKVEHTFTVGDSVINYMNGSYLNLYVVDGKPYYIISHYAKPYVKYYDETTFDPVLNDNNSFILTVYDKSFKLVDSLNIAIEKPDDALYRFADFGLFSDCDMSEGYFTEDGERAYVVTFSDYITSQDDDVYDFVIYNSKGEKLKTICEDATEGQWWTLSSIKGFSDQMIFLQTVGSTQQMQMIDIPSCEKKTLIPATINNDAVTNTLDRYPVGDSYQYVIKMSQADTDDDNNTIARIGWYTTDLQLDHMVKINLGENGEYFTPLINEQTLNPYLFNTDDKMEYIYIAKKMRTDGSKKIDNVLEVANEDGDVLRSWNTDGDYRVRIPSVVEMTPTKTQLCLGMYNDDTEDYRLDFFDLPFSKFENGGDGTAANPYLVATVGDMLQINGNTSACYKMVDDIDFAEYKDYWTPITNLFTGTFDGDGHKILNLSINTTESEVGLFSTLGEGSKVKNVTLLSPSITLCADNQYAGFIAGECTADSISNVHIYDGRIETIDADDTDITPSVGGLVGQASLYSYAEGCSFQGNIDVPAASMFGGVGGIYGETRTSSNVAACYVLGTIKGKADVGGIIGSQGTGSTITNCHFDGNLQAENIVGGITGVNSGRGAITNSVATAVIDVSKASWNGFAAGGIVGQLESDWSTSSTTDAVIARCVANVTITYPETSTNDGTIHRIAGYTIANEEESNRTEGALADNYVWSGSTIGGATVSSDDATSVEGKDVEAIDKALLTSLNYAFGSTNDAPWKESDVAQLYFEGLTLGLSFAEGDAFAIVEGQDSSLHVNVYGGDVTAVECVSSNPDVAEVEISDIIQTDGVFPTVDTIILKVSAKKAGTTTITASADGQSVECLVTVGTDGIATVTTNSSLTISQTAANIVANGAKSIAVYSVGGQRIAASTGNSVSKTKMGKGVYIVVATDNAGHSKTSKIVVK